MGGAEREGRPEERLGEVGAIVRTELKSAAQRQGPHQLACDQRLAQLSGAQMSALAWALRPGYSQVQRLRPGRDIHEREFKRLDYLKKKLSCE